MPSILLVSLPDAKMPKALGEMRDPVYQSNSDDSSLGNGNTTAVLEHLKDH